MTVEGLLAQYTAIDLVYAHPKCQWTMKRDGSMEVRIPNYGPIARATPIDRLGGTSVTRLTCTNPRKRLWNHRPFRSFKDADEAVYRSLRNDPMLDDSRWLWDKSYTERWEDQPASEKQLWQLSRYIDGDLSDLTKLQANQVLNYIWSQAGENAAKRDGRQASLAI